MKSITILEILLCVLLAPISLKGMEADRAKQLRGSLTEVRAQIAADFPAGMTVAGVETVLRLKYDISLTPMKRVVPTNPIEMESQGEKFIIASWLSVVVYEYRSPKMLFGTNHVLVQFNFDTRDLLASRLVSVSYGPDL